MNGSQSPSDSSSSHPEPDSTTSGYPDDLEELLRRTLRGTVPPSSSINGATSPSIARAQEIESLLSQLGSHEEIVRYISGQSGASGGGENLLDDTEEDYQLPKALIVTNIDFRVYTEGSAERAQFEETFRSIDPKATFLYFKSFRRARVDFQVSLAATKARILCNQRRIGEENINCYYAEIIEMVSNVLLRPPALEKQFLISPPASPPEGWRPVEEATPILNLDLQSALANLIPGSAHELHAATESQPGIVVHICPAVPDTTVAVSAAPPPVIELQSNDSIDEDEVGFDAFRAIGQKIPIQHTPCPPSMAAAAAAKSGK